MFKPAFLAGFPMAEIIRGMMWSKESQKRALFNMLIGKSKGKKEKENPFASV